MGIIRKTIDYFGFLFQLYILHSGNKVNYLRSLGAIIGNGCDIITKISNFGSEPYLVKLGNNVTITGGVILVTHDGATRTFRSRDPLWEPGMGLYGPIIIGDNVFIGVNTILLPGISIGNESIVGAGSVVTSDIPSHVVAAGNPARIITTLGEYHKKAHLNSVNIDISSIKNKQAELTKHFGLDEKK